MDTHVDRAVPKPGARYDTIASWYVAWVKDHKALLCDPAKAVTPLRLEGERWLEVACGAGRLSRQLAARGARVTGIDLSAELIAVARAEETANPFHVDYRVGDITQPRTWWDGQPFDGAACEMAFMDIDDLSGTVRAVAEVLRPGAPFNVSMVHPCFPGNEAGQSSWPPHAGYQAEGFWTSPDHNPDGVRIRVGSNHRTLATYLNTFIESGFALERLLEPEAPVPTWVILALRRIGS